MSKGDWAVIREGTSEYQELKKQAALEVKCVHAIAPLLKDKSVSREEVLKELDSIKED